MTKARWFTLLLVFSVFALASSGEQRNGVVDVKFTNSLTQIDLDKIQENLKKQDIDLEYDLLEFDDNGKLKKINASIDYYDGHMVSFKSRELQSTDTPGFYRDFSND